jgi:hypothetical protein
VNTDLKSLGNILKQEGTSRYERYLPALDPHTLSLDDRKLQDLIAYAQRYSKNLLYINGEGSEVDPADSWEFFFKRDIILLIANIATKSAPYLKTTYDQLSHQFNESKTLDHFKELVRFTFARYKKISNWYYASPTGSSLNADLRLYIGSYLQQELESLREILFYVHDSEGNHYKPENFKRELLNTSNKAELNDILNKENIWGLKDKENTSLRERIFGGSTEEEKLSNALIILNNCFDAVFHATETIINNCQHYFNETIHQQQDHAPHIALFISFLKLYGYVQEELNKIPQRHLDFYYKEVLRVKAKEATPDQAYVVFELAKGFDVYEIKKGTALSAGKDKQNKELVYETDEDFVVNKAQISSLYTIFIDQNKDNQPLNYYAEPICIKPANAAEPGAVAASWKMFGEAKPAAKTEIGFAIASTQFYLAKGKRTVTISFTFLDAITIEQFDTTIIKLLLTGEEGWLSSEKAEHSITINSLAKTNIYTLDLTFTISIKQESAIIAYNEALHLPQGAFATSFPVFQCILKYPPVPEQANEAQWEEYHNKISQLNVLQKLRISDTSIRVEVGSINHQASFDGIRDLLLQNHESDLDNKKPFYPFTTIPKVGSSFYIGCKDLFYKKIDKLSVNIAWMLPDNFSDHYSKYLPPYDSNKFTAAVSMLKDKEWVKIKDISIIDKDAVEPRFKAIKLEPGKVKLPDVAEQPEEVMSSFDSERKNGTIKLKLNYPDFGHSVYPQLLTSAVMEKAASQNATKNYHNIIKKELGDSAISIKYPEDINERTGSYRVVFDILENVADDERAKNMLVNSLNTIIRKHNGINLAVKPEERKVSEEEDEDNFGAEIVNDDNFIEEVLNFLKKVKLIDKNIHYDEDKQHAGDVINNIQDKVSTRADFMMPGDKELSKIIRSETAGAITRIGANVVDAILPMRQQGMPEPNIILDLIKKEVEATNEVINDMIAHKIALLLSANEIPAAPYSPLISNISISYTSVQPSKVGGDQFFHITPFGNLPINILESDPQAEVGAAAEVRETPVWLKTKYIFPKSIVIDQDVPGDVQGMLLLGIREWVPNQNLSLLVQLAEGTKLTDKKTPAVHWWYLRNYEWVKLKDDAKVSDSTYGLQTTGIIEFSIPQDATNKVNLFGQQALFWLCAGVARETDTFPRLADVVAQATWVTFKDQQNDPGHLALPLAAHKINSLVNKVTPIKKVSQPVSSFDGQVKEQDQNYYIRVSERLRHKSRAISNWDYERLVLEQFPFLYKVKCINNYYAGHFAVGHVTVVPVADLRNRNYKGTDLLLPKTSYIELKKIEEFLRARASPFVRIHAVNPQLDKILISCKVKFKNGIDKGYYLQKLNEDLIYFLTPWAKAEKEVQLFSAKVYASSIIDFIDQRDYVDFVADLVMKQYIENEQGDRVFCVNKQQSDALVETSFTTAHSILVSAPKHEIELVEESLYGGVPRAL